MLLMKNGHLLPERPFNLNRSKMTIRFFEFDRKMIRGVWTESILFIGY